MNKFKLLLFFIIIFAFLSSESYAQLTGIKTIPGDYATIEAAIADLNLNGVGAGGVTFNVAAGHAEFLTSSTSGLINTTTSSASNPIIFQKSGIGENPIVVAYLNAVASTTDGIIKIAGTDYITFDKIDLQENPSNIDPTIMMDWGYALVKKNASAPVDGAQNVVIKNCAIKLNKLNTASIGIYSGNHIATATTALTVSSTADASSNCKFNNNAISNCYSGIRLNGANNVSFYDLNNEIGVDSANSITGFAGGSGIGYGIYANYQNFMKVKNNIVTSSTGTTNQVYGIYLQNGTNSFADITYNAVTIHGGGTSSSLTAIRCEYSSNTVESIVNITNNLITGCTYPTQTGGTFFCIFTTSTVAISNISNNSIINNALSGNGGTFAPIVGNARLTVNIDSNVISNNQKLGSSITCIDNNTSGTINIFDNQVTNNILTTTLNSAVFTCITTSTVNPAVSNIYRNVVTGNQKTGGSSNFYCIYPTGSTSNTYNNVVNNNGVASTTTAAASTVYGYYNPTSTTIENVYDNQFANLYNVTANAVTSNITAGIYTNAGTVTDKQIYNNLVHTISLTNSSTGNGNAYGIYQSRGDTTQIYKNKAYNVSISTATGTGHGIYLNSGTTNIVYNNYISDIKSLISTGTNAVIGVNIIGGTNNFIFYNTIYLAASSTSVTSFGSSGISASTTPVVDLRNNIIVNNSTPGPASGFTVVYRRSSITLTTYASSSNNNCFYAGTPAANRLIFYDGSVGGSDQTMANYQTRVAPRDAASFSELPPFTNAAGNNLTISTSVSNYCESGGVIISSPISIVDDNEGTPRYPNPGYPVNPLYAPTAPDVGADEFAGDEPLPVELSSFTASVNGRNIILNWSTVMELNNSGYDIERKLLTEWIKIGNVEGSGTTSESKNYSFNDNNLQSGKYNYRLKQIDYNGNFEYFNLNNEIEVGVPKQFSLSQNYPNPFNPATKIDYDLPLKGNVSLKIYDMSGKEVAALVNESQEPGYYTVQLNASSFSSGVYFYRIITGNFVMTKKMLLIK